MTALTALFIYVLIWWTMLFTVLPMRVRRHQDGGKGYDAGAPEKPDLKRKLIINTIISAVILGIIQVLVVTGVLDWHALFKDV